MFGSNSVERDIAALNGQEQDENYRLDFTPQLPSTVNGSKHEHKESLVTLKQHKQSLTGNTPADTRPDGEEELKIIDLENAMEPANLISYRGSTIDGNESSSGILKKPSHQNLTSLSMFAKNLQEMTPDPDKKVSFFNPKDHPTINKAGT